MNQPSSCPSWAEVYAAVPIEKSTRSIRLLTFHRGAEGSIIGQLKTYNLGNLTVRPEWIALSYTWDSYELIEYDMRKRPDRSAYVIDIQGVEVPVRENLWLALNAVLDQRERHAQAKSSRQSRYMEFINKEETKVTSSLSRGDASFWIDAICINQYDILERNHQVDMMKTIYSDAALVIAWLGPFWEIIQPKEEDSLLSCLRNCAYSSERRWRSQCDCEPECLFDLRYETWYSSDGDPNVPLTSHDGLPHWVHARYSGSLPARAIIEHERNIDSHKICIARSAYWRRMWIIQEVILPRTVVFIYGTILLSPEFLAENLQECTESDPKLSPMHSILHHRNVRGRVGGSRPKRDWQQSTQPFLLTEANLAGKGRSFSLAALLEAYRYNGCTDQRDRVFALLGLMSRKYPIKADYDISPCELLLQVLKYEHIPNSDDTVLRGWAEALGINFRDRDLRRLFRYSRLPSRTHAEVLATSSASSTRQLVRWATREIEWERKNASHRRTSQQITATSSRPGIPRAQASCVCVLQTRWQGLNLSRLDPQSRTIDDLMLRTRDFIQTGAPEFKARLEGIASMDETPPKNDGLRLYLGSRNWWFEQYYLSVLEKVALKERVDNTQLYTRSLERSSGLHGECQIRPRRMHDPTSSRGPRSRKLLQSREHR